MAALPIITKPVEVKQTYPNRWLTRIFLKDIENFLGGPCLLVYHNTLLPAAVAGNHYHGKKVEVFMCSYGELRITLFDREHNAHTRLKLSANPESQDNHFLLVPAGVAHAVKNSTDQLAIITVFTNAETHDEDTFPYKLM